MEITIGGNTLDFCSGAAIVSPPAIEARDSITALWITWLPAVRAVISMIAVGEQTGGLDEMLSKIADFYDEEVDAAVEALLSLMEPVMIVVLGVIVGGMVVAMYLPIFDMVNAVQ